jgi:hypothetical protein
MLLINRNLNFLSWISDPQSDIMDSFWFCVVFHHHFGSTEPCHNQVLSDEKKRSLYDQYGEAGVKSVVGGSGGAYTVLHFRFCLLRINSIQAFLILFPVLFVGADESI